MAIDAFIEREPEEDAGGMYREEPSFREPVQGAGEAWGSGAGFDLGDLIDAPWRAGKSLARGAAGVLGHVGTALDTFGRPVRTYLSTGDANRSIEAAMEPYYDVDPSTQAEVTATQLRRQYLGADKGTEGDGFFRGSIDPRKWDYGDAADTIADVGVGTLTDPLSLLSFGATSAGKNAARFGHKYLQAIERTKMLAPEAREASRVAAAADFFKGTGKQVPEVLPPNWTGTEAGMLGRMAAGETGVSVGIPFTNIQTSAAPLNSSVARVAAVVSNPFEVAIGLAAETKAGQAAIKWAGETWDFFSNPSIRDAMGLNTRRAEGLMQREVEAAERNFVLPAKEKLEKAGLDPEQWHLVEDVLETLDPRASRVNLLDEAGAPALSYLKGSRLSEQYEKTIQTVSQLPSAQQAAIYGAVGDFHSANVYLRERAEELGAPNPLLGSEIFKAPAKLKAEKAALEKELQKAVENDFNAEAQRAQSSAEKGELERRAATAEAELKVQREAGVAAEKIKNAWREAFAPPADEPVLRLQEVRSQRLRELTPRGIREFGLQGEEKLGKSELKAAVKKIIQRAERVSEAESAREVVEALTEDGVLLPAVEIQRVAKVLGRDGTSAAIVAGNVGKEINAYPGVRKVWNRLLSDFPDGDEVVRELREKYKVASKVKKAKDVGNDFNAEGDPNRRLAQSAQRGAENGDIDVGELGVPGVEVLQRHGELGTRYETLLTRWVDDEAGALGQLEKYFKAKGGVQDPAGEARAFFTALEAAEGAVLKKGGSIEDLTVSKFQEPSTKNQMPISKADGLNDKGQTANEQTTAAPAVEIPSAERLDASAQLQRAVELHARPTDELGPEELRIIATTSKQTGLPNKRAFDDAIAKQPGALVMHSDMDGLKFVNDTVGHEAGDVLLALKARAMVQEGVQGFHFSGDEFAGLFKSEAEAAEAMERVAARLRASEVVLTGADGKRYVLREAGFSYGIGKNGHDAEAALKDHKSAREQRGERGARGSALRGIREITPRGEVPLDLRSTAGGAGVRGASSGDGNSGRRGTDAQASGAAGQTVADIQRKIGELDERIVRAQRLAKEVPNYFPFKVDPEIDVQRARGGAGAAHNALGKERGTVFGEERPELQGVPMTSREAAELYASGGTRATQYETAREGLGAIEALKVFFTADKGQGLAAVKKAAKEQTEFFVRNPVEAYARQIAGPWAKSIKNAQLRQSLGATFRSIAVKDFDAVVKAARGSDEEFDQALSTFKRNNGVEMRELIEGKPQDLRAHLQARPGTGPAGWKTPQFWDGEPVFLPGAAADKYDRYMDLSTKRLPAAIEAVTAPLSGYMRIWKAAQTWLWPSYHVRNQVSDLWRMAQEEALDAGTAGDLRALWRPIKMFTKGVDEHGFLNYGAWSDAVIDLGARGQVRGDQFLKLAAEEGVIGGGYTQNVLMDAAERASDRFRGGARGKLMGGVDKFKSVLAWRDDVNRLSAFAARMRAGDEASEAALRAEEALFNYGRLSPAADFLRKTGIAPFASWMSKNLPAQVDYALRNPAGFMATLRLTELLQGGEIPEHLLPEFARNKYQIVMQKEKDEQGREHWTYVTPNGVIPALDLVEAARAPKDVLTQQLGPLAKMMVSVVDDREGNELRGAENLIGKPLAWLKGIAKSGQIDAKTGYANEGLAWNVLGRTVLPLSPGKLRDVEGQARKSLVSGARREKGAWTAYQQAVAARNQAGLLYEGADPEALAQYDAAIETARAKYEEAKAAAEKERRENEKVLRRVRAVSKAP